MNAPRGATRQDVVFSDPSLLKAVIAAKRRGVKVR